MFVIVLVTALCIFIARLFILQRRTYRRFEKIPGPPTIPFIGNILEFRSDSSVLDVLLRLTKEYGNSLRLWLHPMNVNIITTDPKYLEYFLATKSAVDRSVLYKYMCPWLGNSTLTTSGVEWRKRRKLVAPTFTFINLEKFLPEFNDNVDVLVQQLKMNTEYEPINIIQYISSCVMDITYKTLMYSRIKPEIKDQIRETISAIKEIVTKRVFSGLLRNDWIYQLTNHYKRQNETSSTMHNIVNTFIDKRKAERTRFVATDKVRTTLLDLFLNLSEQDASFTDTDIRDELITISLAGYETTSTGVSFCLYELSKKPQIQAKILEELQMILGGGDANSVITFEQVQKLQYLDCVFKESLRMYPPIPLFERNLHEDMNIDGTVIPRGSTVSFFTYGMHHDEKLYPEPDKFDPDRFLPENSSRRHLYAYTPFGAGIRNCIGQKFALIEAKIMIAKIVKNFEIAVADPEHKPILAAEISLTSVNELPIVVRPRK